jgi:hypothetical protein
MKRKATLPENAQADAKPALHRLRLHINRLERDLGRYRRTLDDYTPIQTPSVFDVLVARANTLRSELARWSNVVNRSPSVRLIDVSITLHRKLSVIESDLEWDQQMLIGQFSPQASGYVAN